MANYSLTSLLTLSIALCALPALAQPKAAPPAPDALKENFLAEHELGRRFSIDPTQLPVFSANNPPVHVPGKGLQSLAGAPLPGDAQGRSEH